jgi:hypothetical protein
MSVREITVILTNLPPEFDLGDVICNVEWDGGDIYTLTHHDATNKDGGDVSAYVDAVIAERAEEKARELVELEVRETEIEMAVSLMEDRWLDS